MKTYFGQQPVELINTAGQSFDPISELLFLDHSWLLSHGKSSSPSSTANPEIFRHLPVTMKTES